jgi:hypothetical protein
MGLFCRIVFSGPARPMFHVKHSCVKGLPSQPARRDVSRETILSSALTHPRRAPRCFT